MNFFNEYALLVAVAVPVFALVGLNVFLWWGGERGTLMMPSSRYEVRKPIDVAEEPIAAPVDETPAPTASVAAAPANDPHAREAA
jgi:hypothetical protein